MGDSRPARRRRFRRASEGRIRAGLFLAALVSVLAVAFIVFFLIWFTLPIVTNGRLAEIFAAHWRPFQGQFGILPMIVGSLCLGGSALLLAYPMGLGVCLFANGLGPGRPAAVVMAVIHFMTSIPTVVYGFASVFLLTPLIRAGFRQGTGYCWLAALMTLSLLVLPTIVLMINTQLKGAEARLRLTCAALGMTASQKLLHVALPQSRKGLMAAAALGFGRAAGDTLIPLMLAGNAPQFPDSLLDSIRTLTSHIALVVATDSGSAAYTSLFACGLILFAITAAVNLGIRRITRQTPEGSRA